MFITHYLYRNFRLRAMTALLAGCLLVPFCAAQVLQDHTRDQQQNVPSNTSKLNSKTKKRGPRALGIVEFLPGGKARLVPIALWINDRFYDASLYAANPEPMALEPETVYEATSYGEPTGLFTVTTPEEVKGSWVAMGDWKPHNAMDEKIAQQKAKEPKPKPKGVDPNDDRPVLKRGPADSPAPSSGGGASSGSSDSAGASSPEPPDRPVLTKPKPAPSDADSTAQTAPANQSSNAGAAAENDPDRPTLRRGGQPEHAAAPTEVEKTTAQVQAAQAKLTNMMTTQGRKSYPAISDAGSYESRSMLYTMNTEERNNKSEQMRALALAEIGKFIATRKTPTLPKGATISDYDLRSFDLDYSNSPTLVLTAMLPLPTTRALRGGEFDYFVTVVAREDINGTPVKIFSMVSDSNHLDAFPRMEIIDAVDADANGRGDLLFRQHSDSGINYGLFRVYPYDMQKVFEGGASM
jgi:hypothetical protein